MTTRPSAVLPVDLGDGPFAITTRGVTKRFGSVDALSGLDLQVPEGAVYTLVGPNGAGKTTLIRALVDIVRRDAGSIEALGFDPATHGGEVRSLVGYVPEHHDLGYAWMTVGRLLEHHAVYYLSWDREYAARLVGSYGIDLSRKCRTLSKGQRRRVQIILALAHRPPLLFLDEPTDGLDHVIRETTLGILAEHLADSPTTALISTHRVYEIERLVDHVGVLREGRLLGQLPIHELKGKLRRYWADTPAGWQASGEILGRVIRRAGGAQDIEWTIWGDEGQVVQGLDRAGATVREVAALTVDEAATALLSAQEVS